MTDKKVRIVHIITGLDTGGAEMMLLKVLSGMDPSRFDSVVVCLGNRGTLAERIEALGIKVYSVGMRPERIPLVGFWRLVRQVRRLKPDIIQGWMYHGNLAAQVVAVFLSGKVPVLWNIRGSHTDLHAEKLTTALTIWLGARLSPLPIKIINNSRESALSHEQKLSYPAQKHVIIPNGFDTDLFSPYEEARVRFRAELGLPKTAFLIGLVARYHPIKDHSNFFIAASHLLPAYPRVHFVLVGKGVDFSNAELMEKIKTFRLVDSTHLLGERDDLPYLNAALDIAVSSSYGEGFPNVIGEAMSCGVPCVVTDVGSSARIVGDAGRVVPPRDPITLAHAMSELMNMDSESRRTLGRAARERVIENFSLDAVVRKYEALYEEVYASGTGEGR